MSQVTKITHNNHRESEQGFTLVELSIVLVIIGLIIGGVLVGQDMIKAAEVRATLQQQEKYNAAINTFRTKYQGIPGDLPSVLAARFNMFARTGADGHGDGNGVLEGCSTAAGTGLLFGCETGIIWRDLAWAQLIEGGAFDQVTDTLPAAAIAASALPDYLPPAKIGRGNYWAAFSVNGLNFYQLGGVTGIATTGVYTTSSALTPLESFNMDNKVDDGKPLTGAVLANSGAAINTLAVAAAPAVGVCVSNTAGAGSPYNMTGTAADPQAYANAPACQLRFRVN